MNILFISHVSSMYGANSSLLDILQYLNRDKFKAYVVIPDNGDIVKRLKVLNIPYKIIKMYSTVHSLNGMNKEEKFYTNVHAMKEICKYIKEWNIDIVHTNSSVLNLGAISAVLTGKKHVWHIRELPIQYSYRSDFEILDCLLMRKAESVICISKFVKREMLKKLRNTALLYDPIDIKKYLVDRNEVLSKETVNILACGLISENKKQLIVVQAVKLLRERGYNNVNLTIVGDGSDYRSKILRYIKTNQLEESVKIHPFSNDLSLYRKNADIAVMSSVYEALGRVTIESMLSELVLIGADSGATSELIKDNYNGFKYNPESPEELADKLEYVLNNKNDMLKIVKNAKRFALKRFNAEEEVKKLEQLYIKV